MYKYEKIISQVDKRKWIVSFQPFCCHRLLKLTVTAMIAAVLFNSTAYITAHAEKAEAAATKSDFSVSQKESAVSDSSTNDKSQNAEDKENSGWILIDEKAYYIGKDGKFYTGSHTIDETTYKFTKDGVLENGWVLIDNIRYHFSSCTMSKGGQTIDKIYRHLNDDGTMFVGWYKDKSGNWHYYDFETGAGYRCWRRIDGKRYYFNTKGILARNTVIDGIKVGADGAAVEDSDVSEKETVSETFEVTEDMIPDSLKEELDSILKDYGSTPLEIYNYVHDHYKYKYAVEGSIVENAQHLLDYGTGSCYNFASLTYLLFQRAGYDVRYVTGKGWQPGPYHCWIMAYFDGGWYFVDSLYVRSAKLTAQRLRELGYQWDEMAYPA